VHRAMRVGEEIARWQTAIDGVLAASTPWLGRRPAADELAVRRRAHADAANSFGNRVRL
jgi:hypothetical protein